MTTPPGILNVILRRREVATAVAAVVGALDDTNTTSTKDSFMSTATSTVPAAPVTPAPTASAPVAPWPTPDVLAKIGSEVATLEQLESAFAGETEFVLASLREKRTLAQAQAAYIGVLKDRNTKLAAAVEEKDKAIKGLGNDGLGITAAPAAVVEGGETAASGKAGGFKTYEQAVEHYQKAGDKQAFRTAAISHPALHNDWRARQGEQQTKAAEARELKKRGGGQS
jgi:hypothetical protein